MNCPFKTNMYINLHISTLSTAGHLKAEHLIYLCENNIYYDTGRCTNNTCKELSSTHAVYLPSLSLKGLQCLRPWSWLDPSAVLVFSHMISFYAAGDECKF